MLALRTTIGLTQAGLANYLGVSRRAVGEWEGGSRYPKVGHLKQIITLGVEQQAFAAGREAEEIRQFWEMAHQKVLLDDRWVSALLAHPRSSHVSAPVGGQKQGEALVATPTASEEVTENSSLTHPASGPRVDWGDALAVPIFYGREEEQRSLLQWVVQDRCRVVSVLGIGGIGKSALAVSMMYQMAEQFEVVIFRPLRDAPSCETLLDECLQVLSTEPISTLPATLEQRIRLFLEYLRKMRALVVLDNLESLLEEGDIKGQLRRGFEGYGQLLQQVAGTVHQSCLLLTSREKPAALRGLASNQAHSPVRSLRLAGLDDAACSQLFEEIEVGGTKSEQAQLIKVYGGNPLALKIVGKMIFDLFGGEIGPFLVGDSVLFGSITDLLSEQFARLSALERSILCWLAIVREPVTLNDLQTLQVVPLPLVHLLEAVDAGYRRSLIERGKRGGSFTLQSVVLEYVTGVLIAEGSREIQQGLLARLIEHGLSQATAREYVRQTQERLLLSPLLADLSSIPQRRAPGAAQEPRTAQPFSVEQQLLSVLGELRGQEDSTQGYGPANLIALLRVLRGNLCGLDLSQLCIRGAYFQGIAMQDAKLSGTMLRDTVWTSAFDIPRAVSVSRDGKLWAAGSVQGKVRVWDGGAQTLHLIWQAHTDITNVLAFSPDGRALASASYDGTVKLWDLEHGGLLWMGWHTDIVFSVAFAPNGRVLASSGADGVVRLWDVTSGTNLQTLSGQDRVLFSVEWSPDGSLLAVGCSDGNIRLWHMQETESATYVAALTGHTKWVLTLAFAPNGRQLASGSWDGTVRLWDVADRYLCQTLMGHSGRVMSVAWSWDGRVVASASFDKTVRLWDVERSSYRAVLHGHTAFVYSAVFTPDGSFLLSGSEDGTVRVWDVTNGQCVRVIEGCAVSLQDVAWSPDSTRLACVGTDALVTIWDLTGGAQSRVLRGHSWHVFGVVWSPDGRLLASSGRDNAIRLWDPVTGDCQQVLRDPDYVDTMFYCVAWSSDGHLLASGSYMRGVQVWDMVTRTRRWIGQHPTRIRRVAWSPDGTRLVGSGDDGDIFLWAASDGMLLGRLEGHSGRVMNVAWSPDGTRLASGGGGRDGGELFVWDMGNQRTSPYGELVQTFKGHPDSVFALAWGPTGEVLVSGGSDGTIHWWDVLTGKCLRMREGHDGGVWSLKVSLDGLLLASSGNDATIRVWDLESAKLLRTLRHDRPYERLNITAIRGLNEAEIASLRALGAFDEAIS